MIIAVIMLVIVMVVMVMVTLQNQNHRDCPFVRWECVRVEARKRELERQRSHLQVKIRTKMKN